MEERAFLLTPHIIACEIAMVLNRKRPGSVRQSDVKVEFPHDVDSGHRTLQAASKGIVVEVEDFRTQDLTMKLDEFSERFVEPIAAQFVNAFDSAALQSFSAASAPKH